MPDDKKKEKSNAKPKPKAPAGAPPGAGPPGMDPGAGGPPMGMPPVGGAAMGGGPSMGAPPPMPGSGIDPYAALMGQVSSAPMSMPMAAGPGEMGPGGGPGAGMGMGMSGPNLGGPEMGPGGPGGGLGGPLPIDPITEALMSSANPAHMQPDLAEHALDPSQTGQEQMSMQQILQLLALMQGGIPSSGLAPPGGGPGSGVQGMMQQPMV